MEVNGSLHLIAGGQILNLRVENLALDPVSPVLGQIWFNAATTEFKYYDGITIKIFATGGGISTVIEDLASVAAGEGASMIGIEDSSGVITATTVEGALQELAAELDLEISDRALADSALRSDIASTIDNTKGASLIGIYDVNAVLTATTVEGALSELALGLATEVTDRTTADSLIVSNLVSTSNGVGASLVGINDIGGYFTATTVEGALQELDVAYKAADATITSNLGSAISDISSLQSAVGAADVATVNFLTNNYVTDATDLVAAIGALDGALSSLDTLAGAADLQTAYENSAQHNPDGHARIKLTTGKDLRIVDDSDDSVYFMVDSETGNVVITGNLAVTGNVVEVQGQITDYDNIAVKMGLSGSVGVSVRPGFEFVAVTAEAAAETGTLAAIAGGATLVKNVSFTDGTETFTDNGAGNLNGSAGGTGTIDYVTGAYVLNFTGVAGVVTATYESTDETTYVTPVADILNAGPEGTGAASVRIDSAGVLVTNKVFSAQGGITVNGNIDINGVVDGVDVGDLYTTTVTHLDGFAGKHDASEIDYEAAAAFYIAVGSSVEVAITTLDSEIKDINDALGSGTGLTVRLDNIELAVGSVSGLTGMNYTSTNYVAVDTNVVTAISALDTNLGLVASALTQEVSDRTAADSLIVNNLAATSVGKGAATVGVEDSALKFTGTTVETVLAELQTNVETEASDRTTADTVIVNDLASTANAKGASTVGIEDAAGKINATTVEDAITELADRITNSTFTYTSTAPSTSHTVPHNFGQKYCNVTVIDATDNMVIPQSVVFSTTNQLVVTFNSSIDCVVVCSR